MNSYLKIEDSLSLVHPKKKQKKQEEFKSENATKKNI